MASPFRADVSNSGSSSRRLRSHSLRAVGVVVTLTMGTMLVAVAASGTTVGSPQPELVQFNLPHNSDGSSPSGVTLANGNEVLVAQFNDETLAVCVVHPGARKCSSNPHVSSGSDSLYGSAVVTTGGSDVYVLSEDSGSATGISFPIVEWASDNGGASFGSAVAIGNLYGISSATIADGEVVIAGNDPHLGTVVQSFNATSGGQQTEYANPSGDNYDATVSTYDNGVLLAADNGTTTSVWYAPSNEDPGENTSYTKVGTFAGQEVAGLSGNALLTVPSNSLTTAGKIAFFNGTKFSTGYKVPDSKAGDDGYFTLATTGPVVVPPSSNNAGHFHVFFEGRRDGYDEIEETTTNGVAWSAQTFYGSAVDSDTPIPVLGPTGAGTVFEPNSWFPLVQPVLNPQAVKLTVTKRESKAGVADTFKGQSLYHVNNLSVELQVEVGKGWNNVKSTHQSTTGAFSFTMPAKAGIYRAVVAQDPGYFEIGYSNSAEIIIIR
jgi:hypothetical protein